MRTLITGGVVMTMDPGIGDLAPGDVLIEDDRIAAVGPRLDVGDAQRIDATNRIVMPGLIDTHRHLWQSAVRQVASDWTLEQYVERMLAGLGPGFRAEDVQIATLLGCLEALNAGITTIFDWAHIINTPEHADAAVAGLTDSGIRAVFGYGLPGGPAPEWYAADLARVRSCYFSSPSTRVTVATSSAVGTAPSSTVFQYAVPDQRTTQPRNSDVGGHHVALYVEDIDSAVAYLMSKGITVLGEPIASTGPSEGQRWVYFLSPWRMQFELVSYPGGKAFER